MRPVAAAGNSVRGEVRTGIAPRNMETVMTYVLLGKQSDEWLTGHDERLILARAKAREWAGTISSTSRARRRRKPC